VAKKRREMKRFVANVDEHCKIKLIDLDVLCLEIVADISQLHHSLLHRNAYPHILHLKIKHKGLFTGPLRLKHLNDIRLNS
jgi:hypothetical protein